MDATGAAVEQLVNCLSFEVEATPHGGKDVGTRSSTNMTPVNVKIRVRKKQDAKLAQNGVIMIPRKQNVKENQQGRVRLVSSDQTIMSFNMIMETDADSKPKKGKKYLFGGCLGSDLDKDDIPYHAGNADDSSTISNQRSESIILRRKLKLSKNAVDDLGASRSDRKPKKFFGKCKPGGCLDPPFDEDRYAYLPESETDKYTKKDEFKSKEEVTNEKDNKTETNRIIENETAQLEEPESDQNIEKLRSKNINLTDGNLQTNDEFDVKETDRKTDRGVITATRDSQVLVEIDNQMPGKKSKKLPNNQTDDDLPVVNIYPNKTNGIDEVDSNSIITYPPALSYSELMHDDEWLAKNTHSNRSSGTRSRKSFNEFNTTYYTKNDNANKDKDKKNAADKTTKLMPEDQRMATDQKSIKIQAQAAGTSVARSTETDNKTKNSLDTLDPKKERSDRNEADDQNRNNIVGNSDNESTANGNTSFELPKKLHEKSSQERHSSIILKKLPYVSKDSADIHDEDNLRKMRISQTKNLTIIDDHVESNNQENNLNSFRDEHDEINDISRAMNSTDENSKRGKQPMLDYAKDLDIQGDDSQFVTPTTESQNDTPCASSAVADRAQNVHPNDFYDIKPEDKLMLRSKKQDDESLHSLNSSKDKDKDMTHTVNIKKSNLTLTSITHISSKGALEINNHIEQNLDADNDTQQNPEFNKTNKSSDVLPKLSSIHERVSINSKSPKKEFNLIQNIQVTDSNIQVSTNISTSDVNNENIASGEVYDVFDNSSTNQIKHLNQQTESKESTDNNLSKNSFRVNDTDNIILSPKKNLSEKSGSDTYDTINQNYHVKESLESSTTSSPNLSPQPSIAVDLAFRNYLDYNKERILKSLDTNDAGHYKSDEVILVKTSIKPDKKGITIPIDREYEMDIKINKPDTNSHGRNYKDGKRKIAKDVLFHGIENNEKDYRTERAKFTDGIVQDILNSIYEQQLVPLQIVINNLKEDIDALVVNQMMLRDRLLASKVRPSKWTLCTKRCVCLRK